MAAELDGLLLRLLPGALLLLWSRWFHLPDLERRQRMLKRLLPAAVDVAAVQREFTPNPIVAATRRRAAARTSARSR